MRERRKKAKKQKSKLKKAGKGFLVCRQVENNENIEYSRRVIGESESAC
jgi:hypothetical protein